MLAADARGGRRRRSGCGGRVRTGGGGGSGRRAGGRAWAAARSRGRRGAGLCVERWCVDAAEGAAAVDLWSGPRSLTVTRIPLVDVAGLSEPGCGVVPPASTCDSVIMPSNVALNCRSSPFVKHFRRNTPIRDRPSGRLQ
jgi:hypothetical protein